MSSALSGFTAPTGPNEFPEALPRIPDDAQKLVFLHRDDLNALEFRLGTYRHLEVSLRNEKRPGILLLVLPAGFQEALQFRPGGRRHGRRYERVAENEATRGIHEGNAIERAVPHCLDRDIV